MTLSKAHGRYDEIRGYGWATACSLTENWVERGQQGSTSHVGTLNAEFLPSAGQPLGQTLLFPLTNNMVFSGRTRWVAGILGWEQNWR